MAKMPMDLQEAILGCLKSLHVGLGAVMTDVAAIGNTAFDGPGERETYKSNLKLTATAKPMVDQAPGWYDDLLEELADPNGWRN
jgi:hypothetical protein